MNKKYFDNVVVNSDTKEDIDNIFNIFRRCNKYIDETTPWILAKEKNNDRLKKVMYNLLESIRIGAVLLSSFLPETSEKIFAQLNTNLTSYETLQEFGQLKEGKSLNNPEPLFKRIEK